MHVEIRRDAREAVRHATELLIGWIRDDNVRRLMVAGGLLLGFGYAVLLPL